MCRHLAYLGPPASLADLLIAPEHGLYTQSWAPRRQTHGVVNADGFGVGWWVEGRSEPALYRRAQPIWTDASFASIASVIDARAVLASVRSATPGFAVDEAATPPFASGPWLFAHNGAVDGFNEGVNVRLRKTLSPARAAAIRSGSDSEVLFAMTLDRLDAGATPGEALAATIAQAKGISGGRLNLLLGDGSRIAATTFGNSLFTKRTDDAVIVASEPSEDTSGWEEVPDLSVVTADATAISTTSI